MTTLALRNAAPRLGRRVSGIATTLLVVALVVAWAVELRPQILGGPTAIVVVSGTSMQPGLHTGDLVVVHERDAYRVGDVVAYRVPDGSVGKGNVVIHRIVGGSAASGFVLRGDNRDTQDQWRPMPADIVGRRWVTVPSHGAFVRFLASPLGFATLAGLFAFAFIAVGGSGATERRPRAGR